MLGWALNRASGNASTDATIPDQDDTNNEQPDTPAPVFAARAFRRALFGTPGPAETAAQRASKPAAGKLELPRPANADSNDFESPSKPQGILLTPGTGTSRRKRVSFGRDVKSNVILGDSDNLKTRPRTRLQEALEKSRKRHTTLSSQDNSKRLDFDLDDITEADDAWEEVDELDRDPDITVDLNDPRSQSGLYWKTEFQKYHTEARAEMEKLVKYKQLAKSYAKAKDAEALDLNERLREEQAKVLEMEQQLADLAERIGTKPGQGDNLTRDDRKLLRDLSRQTTLATQYRTQVEELEALLKESGYEADGKRRRRGGPLSHTSQSLEDQRELKRSRERLKELSDLRQELQRVKSNLSAAEQRERKLEVDKRKVSADLVMSELKIAELERKLSKAENDRQRKDNQYEKLKADYDALMAKSKAQKGNITGLRRSQRTSKIGDTQTLDDFEPLSNGHDAQSRWAKELEDLQAQLREEQEARRREVEDASVTISNLRQEYKRASGFKSLDQRLLDLNNKRAKASKLDDDTNDILQSRTLKEKRQMELPLGRSMSRGSKRKASASIGSGRLPSFKEDMSLDALDLQTTGTLSRETRAATGLRGRSSAVPELRRAMNNEPKSPAIGRAKDRSQARKLDLLTGAASTGATGTMSPRSALSADRRAAAMARLEQKRAERRRAFPGKENLRL